MMNLLPLDMENKKLIDIYFYMVGKGKLFL